EAFSLPYAPGGHLRVVRPGVCRVVPKWSPTEHEEVSPLGVSADVVGVAGAGARARWRGVEIVCGVTQLFGCGAALSEYAGPRGGGVLRGVRVCPVGQLAADRATADWAEPGGGGGSSAAGAGAGLPALAEGLPVG